MGDYISELRIKQLEARVNALEAVILQYQKKFENFNEVLPLKINGDIKMNEVGDAIFLTGNDTYKYRELLKEMGGKWERTSKCWVYSKDSKDNLISAGIKQN